MSELNIYTQFKTFKIRHHIKGRPSVNLTVKVSIYQAVFHQNKNLTITAPIVDQQLLKTRFLNISAVIVLF